MPLRSMTKVQGSLARRQAAQALREAGAEVVGVATIVERGARARVEGEGLAYRSAYDLRDLGLT